MRILFLTQWFDPEPTPKGIHFAKHLQNQGNTVEVLTGFPNYPGGKLYPGYKIKWQQREMIDGIIITRVPLFPSHDHSKIKRILNYFSFAFFSFLHGFFKAKHFDVIYVYHPPATVGLTAAMISLFRRKPFVYDIQDLWPDTLRATGMIGNERILNLISQLCDFIYSRATHIIVSSPGFKTKLVARGVAKEKIEIIYNWCDEEALLTNSRTTSTEEFGMAGRFNILFAGNMGKAQGLETILSVAKKVVSVNPSIQFVFIGDGLELVKLKQLSQELELHNVLFLPKMPIHEINQVISQAEVLLVHLKNDPLFEITIPSKTQAYLASGKPILMAVRGDAAELVQQAKAGFCAKPEDVSSIMETVLQMASLSQSELDNLGKNGAVYYRKHLSIAISSQRYLEIFKKCVSLRETEVASM